MPVHLVYFEVLENKSQALKREIEIKKLSHSEKVKIIENKNKKVL